MFIELNLENVKTYYALYTLTTLKGEPLHCGIVPFNQLMAFADLPETLRGEDAYLSIVDTGADKLKLVNTGIAWADGKKRIDLRNRILEELKREARNKGGKTVQCIETGETFPNATTTARVHSLTYGALLKHLRRDKGFKSVKGKTYRYV